MNELHCTKSNTSEIITVKKKLLQKAVILKSMSSHVGRTRFHFSRHLCGASHLIILAARHGHTQTHTHTLSLTLGFCRSLTILVQLSDSAALSLNFQTASGFDQQRLPPFHLRPFHCRNVITILTISRHYGNLCARHPVGTRLCATFECRVKTGR